MISYEPQYRPTIEKLLNSESLEEIHKLNEEPKI